MLDITISPALLRGAIQTEPTGTGLRPLRLPTWARAQVPDAQLAMAQAQPAGVRLIFSTAATVVELDTVPTRWAYRGTPPRPDGMYDLLVDGRLYAQGTVPGGIVHTVDMATGATETSNRGAGTVRFDGLPRVVKDVEIWLPYNETTDLIALRTDAPIEPAPPSPRPVWLHHGSSVSQGSSATSPTGTWPAVAALGAGADLVNLGFGGSALLDPFTARAMRDTPAELISVKIGINLVNTDTMRLRTFVPAVHGFLDLIRDGHPDTPLVVVSPLYCPIHENTPGPGAFDFEALRKGQVRFRATGDPAERAAGKLTLAVIREHLAAIVAQRIPADPNLHYVDGLELYGEADHDELPLPDALHPDAVAHRRISDRFSNYISQVAHS